MKQFKAGDFTSGKMSEIFKECYINDIAIINHKQFGKSYMIPDVYFRTMATELLVKNKRFKEFVEMNFGSLNNFNIAHEDDCFCEINEYFGAKYIIEDWFTVLSLSIAG